MDISGVIFDMDGTLLNSNYIWRSLGDLYLPRFGLTPRADCAEQIWPLTFQQTAEYFRATYALPLTAEEIRRQITEIIEEHYCHRAIPPMPGAPEYVKALHSAGIPALVATATDLPLARAALENAGLLPFLSGVLSCSTLGFGKETPRVYHAARQQLGTALDTAWVFEDTALAIASAKAGGYHVVQIHDPVREAQVGPVVTAADLNIFSYDQLPRPQGRP